MEQSLSVILITIITTDSDHRSVFVKKTLDISARGGMNITDQLPSLSCRLRTSTADYRSDWHLAGDPTLILIQQGTLRIYLQDNHFQDFSVGDYFVAQDTLPKSIEFDPSRHGHRAEVLGKQDLRAVHVKLASAL